MTFTRLNLVFATSALLLTTACVTNGVGPNDNRNSNRGAAIGAGLGALTGVITGDTAQERRRNAALGAIVGGVAGAAIGNRLDQQEEELRRQLGGNVGIVNNGNNLTVTLPQDILFATNSTTVSGSAQSDLFTLASSINRYPDTTVNVIGHTDNVGGEAFNMDLSQRRAQSVSSILINAGVSPQRIRSFGRGLNQPVASNADARGRQANRRVEIIITPN